MTQFCEVVLEWPRVVVSHSQPFFPNGWECQDGLDVPAACFPIICVEHSASPTLPDDHHVVQPELDETVPPESFMARTWLGDLHGFPQFPLFNRDPHDLTVGIGQTDAGVQAILNVFLPSPVPPPGRRVK